MAELRALIVDDEPLARRGIRQLLESYPDVVVAAEARDGREALRCLESVPIDLVFLDIQMPGLDGLGVIRSYGAERMPTVVFVTAHDQFAVRAFEAHALDYLVKPLSAARFAATMLRVRAQATLTQSAGLADRLRALLAGADGNAARPGAGRLAVPTGNGQLLLDPAEIDWIEADDYYARIHAGGKTFRIRESLTSLGERLDPSQFLQIHRSTVVRLDRIREVVSDSGEGEASIVLHDGRSLPVSRRRLARLRARLMPSARRR